MINKFYYSFMKAPPKAGLLVSHPSNSYIWYCMKMIRVIPVCVLIIFLNIEGNAQQLYFSNIAPRPTLTFTLFKPSSSQQQQVPLINAYSCIVTRIIPKGAIFCRLEDALHKRFNFWIKFRMGTDDKYSD